MSVPQIQTQTAVDLSTLLAQKKTFQSDAPRVLYQCADCEVLFDALSLWQQHRKMGCCLETGPGPGGEQSEESLETEAQPQHGQPEYQDAEQAHEQMELTEEGGQESTSQVFVEVSERVATPAISQHGVAGDSVPNEPPEVPVTQEAVPVETSAQENSPVTRRRGQKKAKPPSSLLCVECGQSFSMVPELVTHRKTQHGLKDAIHRCTVCGEGFLNTTLFLYHRKQHRSEVEDEPKQAPPTIPQLSTAMLEAPGEGLLLLATAGEGQSLMEVTTTLEQTITETPVAHLEVELDSDGMRGTEALQTEQEPAVEGTEILVEERDRAKQDEGMEVVIDKMEMEMSTVVEETQAEVDCNAAEESVTGPSSAFLCHQCGSVFTSDQELATHRRTEHGLEAALHSCAECGAEFMSTTQFLYHRREHKNTAAGYQPDAEVKSRLYSPAAPAIFVKPRDSVNLRQPGQTECTQHNSKETY